MATILKTRKEQALPKLTTVQIARLERHGKRIRTHRNEVLAEPGDRNRHLLVVISGSIEISRPGITGREVITVTRPVISPAR